MNSPQGVVYFIRNPVTRLIKIGHTLDIKRRLRTLQCGNDVRLELVGSFTGTPDDEKRLHETFAKARKQGEWFTETAGIAALIESCDVGNRPDRLPTNVPSPTSPSVGPLFDVEGVAGYLATTERHVRELVYRREIPHVHVGRLLRFRRDEIDAWLVANSQPAWTSATDGAIRP